MTINGDRPGSDPGYRAVIAAIDHDLVLRARSDHGVRWCRGRAIRRRRSSTTPSAATAARPNSSPRSVLRRVIGLYRDKGWEPVVAPELEFYLIAKNADPNMPLSPPIGRSGRAETVRRAYSIDAVNEFDPLFEDVYDYCKAMELDVDTLIHEVGAGQMEINFLHGDPLSWRTRRSTSSARCARPRCATSMYATFMAKPMQGEPGSAMHIHQSLLDMKTGRNIFSNPDGTPSSPVQPLPGGLQKYMPAGHGAGGAVRQLVPAHRAPRRGADQRPVGPRQPDRRIPHTRIDAREPARGKPRHRSRCQSVPGDRRRRWPAAGLASASALEPTPESTGSAYSLDYELPRSLSEALTELRDCTALHKVLGKPFVDVYLAVKELEYAEFMKVISPWEREHLLLHV